MSKLTCKLNVLSKKISKFDTPLFFSLIMMVIFITTAGFNEVEDKKNSDPLDDNICTLTVDAGEDVRLCDQSEVILTASVSGQSQCTDCANVYKIENTLECRKNYNYVLWLKDDKKNKVRTFSNVDLSWSEFADGTATLKGTVVDNNDAQITLDVDVTYSGKTTTKPQNSPKNHFCYTENSNGWIYYTGVTGTITQTDGSWSFDITRRGPSFQLGNGANVSETEIGKYGGSGWFDTTDSDFNQGDFNINIGDCILSQTDEVNYLWSTGETTPSITVDKPGLYTVTVGDCNDCGNSDAVEVIFDNTPTVDLGEDQEVCIGESVTLTAGDADSYEWSTGETTQSITVTPDVTTEYSVTVSNGNCTATGMVKVTVTVLNVSAGEDQVICTDGGGSTFALKASVTLTASQGDTYLWSTGETTQSITVSPDITTGYSVIVTLNGCEGFAEVVVVVKDCGGSSSRTAARAYPTLLKSNGEVALDFMLTTSQQIRVSVHNLSGGTVGPIITKNMPKGKVNMNIDLNDFSKLSSGIYMISIKGDNGYEDVQRIIIN